MGIYHPFSFLTAGWRHRALILRLAQRSVQARYRGSMLGSVWTVVHPILMLCVYTFVFSTVFRTRGFAAASGEVPFALFLFSGIIIYTLFSECVNEAPRLMLENQMYIKQLAFPVEVLSWVSLASALFSFLVSSAILVCFFLLVQGPPPVTAFYLPLVLVPLILITLGASWLLSSLGTFLRDLAPVVSIATTALLFLSPVFYPITAIPERFQRFYYLNPLTPILENAKAMLFEAGQPEWALLGGLTAGAWVVAWTGYVWFMRTKGAFADVL